MASIPFFQPLSAFIPWLKAYAGDRPVYDVGCGTGHLLKMMWAANIKAMGIDLYADFIKDREVRLRSMMGDARQVRVLREHPGLVLFCRPSHDGWVAETICRNLHHESEVLYVSKPGNQFVDLVDFELEELPAPGLDIELVWKVKKPYPFIHGDPDYHAAAMSRLRAMMAGNSLIGANE